MLIFLSIILITDFFLWTINEWKRVQRTLWKNTVLQWTVRQHATHHSKMFSTSPVFKFSNDYQLVSIVSSDPTKKLEHMNSFCHDKCIRIRQLYVIPIRFLLIWTKKNECISMCNKINSICNFCGQFNTYAHQLVVSMSRVMAQENLLLGMEIPESETDFSRRS